MKKKSARLLRMAQRRNKRVELCCHHQRLCEGRTSILSALEVMNGRKGILTTALIQSFSRTLLSMMSLQAISQVPSIQVDLLIHLAPLSIPNMMSSTARGILSTNTLATFVFERRRVSCCQGTCNASKKTRNQYL